MEVVRRGDVFEIMETITYVGLTHWSGIPYTGSFTCKLPKGTRLVTGMDAIELARGFYCAPVNSWRLHRKLLPIKYRWNPLFAGYSFVFDKNDIGRLLRRVQAS
jgi:hypothetical protein